MAEANPEPVDKIDDPMKNHDLIRGSLRLPLYTDLSQKWELDQFNPQLYIASVFYMRKDPRYETEKPYFFNIPVSESWLPEVKQTNVCYARKTIAITNIRGHEKRFDLDQHGFQLGNLETGLSYDEFSVTDKIVTSYYNEVKKFLLGIPGAIDVLPFDFQVRRNDPTLPAGSRGAPGRAQPFAAVHGDQTINAAFRRLKHFHPEYAKKYVDKRFQIINVWKPLKGPVYNSPLAVCDYRTFKDKDLVPTDIIFPDYLGETYNLWPSEKHRFYFVDGQESHEAWMIKCFDSATATNPEIALFTPHVSFPYGEVGDKFPNRESVEVRTFVFYD